MAKGQAPDYVVSFVKDEPRGAKRWIRVGAAWKHDKGDGLSLRIGAENEYNSAAAAGTAAATARRRHPRCNGVPRRA